ncbi:M protein repeat protein, partial [Opisthorchis viverrini]
MDLLLTFLLCELVLRANALSPTELFCADPDCTTPFSYGIIIQDINTADGILLKKDSPVAIVGKGETAKASIMRVKISDRFAILESSFVREVGETDVKTLKKYVFSGSEPNVRKNATPSSAAVLQTMHHSKMPETDSSTVGTGSTATIDSLPVAPSEANKTMPRLEAPKTKDIGSHGSAPKAPDSLSDDQRKLASSHEKQSPAEIPVDTNGLLNASSENGLKAATVGQHETSGAIDVVERSAGSVTRSSASTTRHEVEELAEKKVGRATKSKVLTTDQEQPDELERTQSTSSSLKMRDDAKVYESETHPDNVVVTAASNDDKQSSFTQDDSSIRNDKSRRRSTDGTSLSDSPTASGDFRNGEEARDTHEHFDETSPNMSESSVTGNSPGSLSNQETESEDIDREDSFKSVTQEPIHEFEDTMEQTSPYTPEDSVTKTQPSVIPNPELEVKDNDGRDPFRRETQDHPTTWNLDAVQQRDAADSQLTGQLPAEEDETSEKARGKDTALEKKETDVEILGLSSEPTINGGEGESIDYYPAFSPSPSSNDTAAPSAQDDGSMLSGERDLSSTAESPSQRQGALPMEKMAGSSTNTSTIEESDMISHKTSSSELVNRSEENIISTGGPDYGVQNEVESANKDDTDMVDSHTESPVSPSLDNNPAVSSNTGSDKLSSTHFLQVEERALQLASRLADQEETNSQLATWAAQMTLDLQQAQREKSAAIDTLNERIQTTEAELDAVRSRLTESLTKITELKETYKLKLADSEQSLSLLRSELSTLTEEKLASEESWKSRLTALEESNQKALEEAKREHEELYYQALDYYGRMKAMRPEMDKLLEARRQAEDRLATTEAELDSLRTTFTTLRSFELALEQEHLIDGNQESRVSPESSGYTVISPPRDEDDSGEVCMDSDKQQSPDGQDGFADDAAQAVDVNTGKTNLEQLKSKLQANLAIFLDTGRLQAKLDVATSQLKSEQAKSQCERQLREELESKVESMERETAELRQKYDLIQEDRNTIQTKLDVLSAYFKERELELQRDLGKHVVVGSESSEALNTCRKRNKELEAEVRALREQVAALRRELAETERVGRRQIAELDKRSHENWLSARAADHQVQELRDENACLRQKLMEAERSTLPPALRAQVLAPARPFLAGPSPPRPNIPPLLPSNPGSLDKRSEACTKGEREQIPFQLEGIFLSSNASTKIEVERKRERRAFNGVRKKNVPYYRIVQVVI